MDKKEYSYQAMVKGRKPAYEEAEVPFHDEPCQNSYEEKLPSGKGFNQSGFKK